MRLYKKKFEGKLCYALEVYRPNDVEGFYGKWCNRAKKLAIVTTFVPSKYPYANGHYRFYFQSETDRQTVIGLIYQSKGVMNYGR